VLVIEDNDTSRELLEGFLAGWRVPAVAVGSAEEGLALLAQRNTEGAAEAFGLVVVDWMLPGMDGLAAAARIRERPETRSLPIVLVSAYAGKEEEARGRDIGVNVFLPKPITASSFLDALMEATGAGAPATRRDAAAPVAREYDGVKVLVAEDNEANQMVASELLARLGIDLDLAANGREAVEMARTNRGAYAAVLMDMQMPEMDGLEATRALRADPAFGDLPIIAMTANAMRQDLEACLQAGMNDYVTKPVDRVALAATLRKWLPARAAGVSPGGAGVSPADLLAGTEAAATRTDGGPAALPSLPGLDISGALARLGIGADALRRMLIRFADGQRKTLVDLRAAVGQGDAGGAGRHAHALAGAAGNLGADTLREAAKALESEARAGNADLAGHLTRVEELAAIVFRSIDTLRGPASAPAGPAGAPPDARLDRRAMGSALVALREALGAGDPDATAAALDALARMPLGSEACDVVARARALAEDYQFEEAASALAPLLDGGEV
jgi:CheY-like chemotaxis protein/HPt (histidine-containing phosphotransfer) domain-containing protein